MPSGPSAAAALDGLADSVPVFSLLGAPLSFPEGVRAFALLTPFPAIAVVFPASCSPVNRVDLPVA